MLFDTFATTVWKPSCAKLRECTKVGYESALNCHILPQWSGRDMDAISVADIESWLDSFDKPGAARKAYAVFRAILRLAFKRGLADNDVTRREIRLPHLRHYEPQVLSASEVRRLLKGFYGHPLEAWLLVSVCAGLRRCESVGVEWADLDLRRGTVTVKRSVQWVAGHETVTEPKTDCFGGLHARFEQPDTVIADVHGASERRQVHENQTVFDRDGIRSAISKRHERCGILPLQLA